MVSKVQRQRELDSVSFCLRSKEQINPDQRTSDSCLYYKAAVYYNVISCLDVRGFKHGYKDLALDSEFDVHLA